MKRIIIFGAGDIGSRAFDVLCRDYEILAYADNKNFYGEKLHGCPIIAPDMINEYEPDLIVVAMARFGFVCRQLKQCGFKNIYVITFADTGFEIENYRLERYESSCLYKNCKFRQESRRWETVRTKGKSEGRRVLFIAYNFPPEGGPAVQRTLKYVKYIREYGYEPIVLTCGRSRSFMRDEELEKEIPENTVVIRINHDAANAWKIALCREQELFDLLYYVSHSRVFMENLIGTQEECGGYLIPDNKLLWELDCIDSIEKFLDMDSIDLIYSTAPSFSQHILGAYLKLKYGIPWVADYRDLWTSEDRYQELYYPATTESERELFKVLEKKLTEYADYITVAGGNWIAGFVDRFGVSESKICEITNGYDEEDFGCRCRSLKKNSQFTLCYNGRLYHKNRNPRALIETINELIDEGRIDREKLQWIINGQVSVQYKKEIKLFDRHGFVKLNDMIPHSKCIDIAMNADLLVFYGEGGDNGKLNYPGKFYEYLRCGTRILCFSGADSFQSEVLKTTKLGENFDYDQKDMFKRFILNEYIQWEESMERRQPELCGEIRRFDRKVLTKKLAAVFDRVLQ